MRKAETKEAAGGGLAVTAAGRNAASVQPHYRPKDPGCQPLRRPSPLMRGEDLEGYVEARRRFLLAQAEAYEASRQ